MRDTGGEREPMWVALRVEDVEFAKFANRLRVSGEIVGCSREDRFDFHHTLNVEPNTEIEVEKWWKPDQEERLQDAVEATENPDVAIATVEEGEAHLHTVAQYGTEERATITATTGKGDYARPRDELFAELTDVLRRQDVDAYILAGPGFTKQDALDYIQDEAPGSRRKHERRRHERCRRPRRPRSAQARRRRGGPGRDSHRGGGRPHRRTDEAHRRGAKVAYGPDSVAEAADFGAVEELLVLDEHLRRERSAAEWSVDVDEIIETTEQKGGEVVVFSGEFDPGQQLANLGGIAALLRYRIE